MGRKRKEETETKSLGGNPITAKKPRKAATANSDPNTEKTKKLNSSKENVKSGAAEKKETGVSDVNKNVNKNKIYSDSSSSSDSESELNSCKTDKKSNSESNSESESDSSDSDSSPTSKEEGRGSKGRAKGETPDRQANFVGNVLSVKSYPASSKSSSSDSYHSDTEEEDKKRRKKQKKMLQKQLVKRPKKSGLSRGLELKQESDGDDDGADNLASNNDELPDWPENDYAELIRRMEAQIPPKDNQKFDSRAAKLDWSKIAFGDYTAEDCLEVWLAICKRIRRFRTLQEILQDARDWVSKPWTNFYRGSKKNRHPDMPSRPLSTYMIYYLEQKDKVAKENPGLEMTQVSKIISEMYKNLSSEQRDKYSEMAAKQRQNFDVKLSEFYKEHPEIAQQQQQRKTQTKEVATKGPRKASNPFKLFLQEQLKMNEGKSLSRKVVEEEAKEKWKNLSDKKKLVWINWALEDYKRYEDEMKAYKQEHPDYIPPNSFKSVLNKDERNIKERLAGKPIKPPNSAYSLFSRVMLQSDPDVKSIPPKERMAEISKKWKEISDAQKMHYEEKVKAMQDTYKLEFASYLEGLSAEEREEELKKNQPKKKVTKSEEKTKKKSLRNNSFTNKKISNKNKEDDELELYKGEPKPPPVKVFDVYLQSFLSERPKGGSHSDKLNEALKCWNVLPEAKKEAFRRKHEELKQKYIADFETFLKGLSPEELKEFSVMKELAKKSKEAEDKKESINGATEDSEDSDEENESSSGSETEGSDSGKSSKSSSSSKDSDG